MEWKRIRMEKVRKREKKVIRGKENRMRNEMEDK
jgi:hypothetical protein